MGDTTSGWQGLSDELDMWPLVVEVVLGKTIFISTPHTIPFSLLGNLPEDNLGSSCVLLLCREHHVPLKWSLSPGRHKALEAGSG